MSKAIKVVGFGEAIDLFQKDLVEKEGFNPYVCMPVCMPEWSPKKFLQIL